MALSSIKNYVRGSFEELTKVVWPTKNQAVRLTIIVLVFCILVALLLATLDFGLSELYNYVLSKIV